MSIQRHGANHVKHKLSVLSAKHLHANIASRPTNAMQQLLDNLVNMQELILSVEVSVYKGQVVQVQK